MNSSAPSQISVALLRVNTVPTAPTVAALAPNVRTSTGVLVNNPFALLK